MKANVMTTCRTCEKRFSWSGYLSTWFAMVDEDALPLCCGEDVLWELVE